VISAWDQELPPMHRIDKIEKLAGDISADSDGLASLLEGLCDLLNITKWNDSAESFDEWVLRTLGEINRRKG